MNSEQQSHATGFQASGPGSWSLDVVHFSRPFSRFQAEVHPPNLAEGFRDCARRYGLLVDALDYRFVNGDAYFAVAPTPEKEIPERFEAASIAFRDRIWRDDLARAGHRMPGEVGAAAKAYLGIFAHRLLDSLDTGEPSASEVPEVLVAGIRLAVDEGAPAASIASEDEVARLRDKIPAEHQRQFDELLGEARLMSRLRDERGLHSDVWAGGIMRRALLAAGARLVGSWSACRGGAPDRGRSRRNLVAASRRRGPILRRPGRPRRLPLGGSPSATRQEALARDLVEQPCLDAAKLNALRNLVARCDKVFGSGPHDIEWAIEGQTLYLLQLRPVTNQQGV